MLSQRDKTNIYDVCLVIEEKKSYLVEVDRSLVRQQERYSFEKVRQDRFVRTSPIDYPSR